MATNFRKQAEELAGRPYTEIMFRDKTTDDDYVYMAVTPELDGCMAQGETMRDARENLRLFRIDYIEHLLENNLTVPEPASMVARTEADSIELPLTRQEPSFDEVLDAAIQPMDREKLFEAQLRIEYDTVSS